MEIENVKIENLTPYNKNCKKHPKKQVELIMNSIKEFGMIDPIGIWSEKNIIVEGHGRYEACKKLGIKEIPCIRLDNLTDEQRRAYTLAHNKVAESDYDLDILNDELEDLNFSFDMEDFGFEFKDDFDKFDKPYTENKRMDTMYGYNLHLYNSDEVDGYYQLPIIKKQDVIPTKLQGFNYALSSKDKNCGIHFFIDDYQFERVWNSPELYVDTLLEYECVLTPDFSLYMDMPLSMKIWNIYRSRLLGNFWQNVGINVIPTISWAEEDTFSFCFDGIEKESIVAVSTIGVKRDNNAFDIWKNGMDEMIKRINPSTILVYGGKLEYGYPSHIRVIYFSNEVTERMKESKKKVNV